MQGVQEPVPKLKDLKEEGTKYSTLQWRESRHSKSIAAKNLEKRLSHIEGNALSFLTFFVDFKEEKRTILKVVS